MESQTQSTRKPFQDPQTRFQQSLKKLDNAQNDLNRFRISNISDEFQGPHHENNIPKFKPSIPCPLNSIPHPLSSIPHPLSSISLPKSPTPKTMNSIPKPSNSTPKPNDSMPKPSNSAPIPNDSVPKPSNSAPIPNDSMPKPLNSIPKPNDSMPKPLNSIPKPMNSAPQPTTSIPKPSNSMFFPLNSISKPTNSAPKPTDSVAQPMNSNPAPNTNDLTLNFDLRLANVLSKPNPKATIPSEAPILPNLSTAQKSSLNLIEIIPINRNISNSIKTQNLPPPVTTKLDTPEHTNCILSDVAEDINPVHTNSTSPTNEQLTQPTLTLDWSSKQPGHKNVVSYNPKTVNPINRNITNCNYLSPQKPQKPTISKPAQREIEPSPYQVKSVYKSREEFKEIFDYLIRIEELEELKPVYEKVTRFHFITKEDLAQLFERFYLFNDKKALKIIASADEEINKLGSTQRKFALFNDYNCVICAQNIESIVVKCNFGNIYDVKISIFHEFCFFEFDKEVPQNVTSFDIIVEESNFDRIKESLKDYLSFNVNQQINQVFLGHSAQLKLEFEVDIPDHSADGLILLNNSQIDAIKNALNYKVSIIQGPPGTGKTQTISSIVYNLDYLCRKRNEESIVFNMNFHYSSREDEFLSNYFTAASKILICAASNSPVFDIKQKLIKLGINVVHVLARSRENEFANEPGTLKYILKERLLNDENLNQLKLTLNQMKTTNPMNPNITGLTKKIGWMERNIEKNIITEAKVVCCTTRVLPNFIFKETSFDFIIIDEATQCIEPDVVFCMMKNVKHLILVGDINQLGPVIKSQKAQDLGYGVSTIQRLQNLGVPLSFLDTQYRMYPFLSGFSNMYIYENKIKNGKTGTGPLIFPKIVRTCGFFYHVQSEEKRYRSSYVNIDEAGAVLNVLRYLRSKNIQYKDIGIITFYCGQRYYLRDIAKKYYWQNLDVMSVDESQGREKEYIILSCVRSNVFCKVGFLNEFRRLNVSMTRARTGLIVCGNANNFCKSELWSKLIQYFVKNNAIFAGDLDNLKAFKPKQNRYYKS